MVYFLGRDVKVGICSEDATHGVEISDGDPRSLAVGTSTSGNIIEKLWNASGDANDGGSKYNSFSDVTSVDITLGKVDEDIAYMGQRTALKAIQHNLLAHTSSSQQAASWAQSGTLAVAFPPLGMMGDSLLVSQRQVPRPLLSRRRSPAHHKF